MSNQMKIENEMTEVAIRQVEAAAETAVFDDLSDEELEARISKEQCSSPTGCSGNAYC
jgi:hypothetical protein